MAQSGKEARDLHVPVLLKETVAEFSPIFERGGKVRLLDGTLGLGGHSEALLEACPDCELLGLDRDAEALALASGRLARFAGRFFSAQTRFSLFAAELDRLGWESVDGALIDIGVSSLQLDEAVRGFSVHGDGPLDMRMDPSSGRSAADLVNGLDESALRDIIARFGEDPLAGRIARSICDERKRGRIETTGRLAELVWRAYPKDWRSKSRHHPATRTFQALRMVVNGELEELEGFLDGILSRLAPGGRLVVITFHSLEDRMVKQKERLWASGCICPPSRNVCTCNHHPEVRLLQKKPLVAGKEELARNPRASSAKLRSVEKLDAWRES